MNRTHDRLFVAVIGARDAGKTTTWHSLFKHPVNTGQKVRQLTLDKAGHYADVFLISGSPEERKLYAADVLDDVDCRIILCSVQYTKGSFESTWDHIFAKEFQIYAQWLNLGMMVKNTGTGLVLRTVCLRTMQFSPYAMGGAASASCRTE